MANNCKQDLIASILRSTITFLDDKQQGQLDTVLTIAVHPYKIDVDECEQQLPATVDDMNNQLLHKYIVAKTIRGLSYRSIDLYRTKLIPFLAAMDKPVQNITTDDIVYYLAMIKTRTHCTNTTLSNTRLVLSSFFTWLHNEQYIARNIMINIPSIKTDSIKESPYTVTDLEKIRGACKYERDRAVVEFLLSTGCRVSEVCRVNRSDIDYNTKELTVIGKGNKSRIVYLSDRAIFYLDKYLSSRKDTNKALFVSLKRPFTRITPDAIQYMLNEISAATNVAHVHPHRFRRTMCCNLVDKGMQMQEVAVIMGHASLDTTAIYYNECNRNIKHKFQMIAD